MIFWFLLRLFYSLNILEDFQPCFMPFRLEYYTAKKKKTTLLVVYFQIIYEKNTQTISLKIMQILF